MTERETKRIGAIINSLSTNNRYHRMLVRVKGQFPEIGVGTDLETMILEETTPKGVIYEELTHGHGPGKSHASGKKDNEMRIGHHKRFPKYRFTNKGSSRR
jgi:hypothetical protein